SSSPGPGPRRRSCAPELSGYGMGKLAQVGRASQPRFDPEADDAPPCLMPTQGTGRSPPIGGGPPVSIDESLPPIVAPLARPHPEVGEAYNRLGHAAAEAGPLDAKTERLVKLAIAVGAGREGAVHSHVRRGQGAGLTGDELRHVALLAITT